MSEAVKNVIRGTVPREFRNWLRSPRNSGEWLLDSLRYSLGVTRSLNILPDLRIVCHPSAYKFYRRAQMEDPQQRDEFHSFVSECWPGMLLFDIGAHFGVFSIAAAKYGGRAIAVDPSPISSRMISCQTMLNSCQQQVRILKAAVSDTSGLIGMLSSGVFTPGYLKVVKGRPRRELTTASAVTVDELTREFGAPTHLKIDVEGHEIAVLKGARNTLEEFTPLLFLEVHNQMIVASGQDITPSLAQLRELGYDTYLSNGKLVGAAAIVREPIVRIVARHPKVLVQRREAQC